jgi:MFS transporter, APGE family, 1-arseno-3-phosphoglycerate exporter
VKIRNYVLVTAGYWAFTLTDGALRMLVLLHFNDLGYSPIAIAFLFLLYEFMGIVTNLLGGWVGARTGLNRTLIGGLTLQIFALAALTLQQADWVEWISVAYVMGAQALAGVAKDLTKMSSKSAVKLVAGDGQGTLFRLVAILTGSKNALKGVGFFLGAALLSWVGYDTALWTMAGSLAVTVTAVALLLDEDIGRSKKKPPIRSILSKSSAINRLAAARFFLFGSRDIWFVVALPIFLSDELGWSFEGIGGFLASWVIGYGIVQSVAPRLLRRRGQAALDETGAARLWALILSVVSGVMAIAVTLDVGTTAVVVGGLIVFGAVFALNSSLHSYLILAYADHDDVALDVGFYYSANATGRLVGTLASGVLYLWGGLDAALWGSAAFVVACWVLTLRLPALAQRGADRSDDGPTTPRTPARREPGPR